MPIDRDDLCATCHHAPSCMNLGRPGRPVFQCEEFVVSDGSWPAGAPRAANLHRPSSRVGGTRRSGAAGEGLCFDCGNRRRCAMRAVEGGIWHCEEYR